MTDGFAALLADVTVPPSSAPVIAAAPMAVVPPTPAPLAWPFVSLRPLAADGTTPVTLVGDGESEGAVIEADDVPADATPVRPSRQQGFAEPIRAERKAEPAPAAPLPGTIMLPVDFIPVPLPVTVLPLDVAASAGESETPPVDAETVREEGRATPVALPTSGAVPSSSARWMRPTLASRIPAEPKSQPLTDEEAPASAPDAEAPRTTPVVFAPAQRERPPTADAAATAASFVPPANVPAATRTPPAPTLPSFEKLPTPHLPTAQPVQSPENAVSLEPLRIEHALTSEAAFAMPAGSWSPAPKKAFEVPASNQTTPATTFADGTAKIAVNFEPTVRENFRRESAPTRNFVSASDKQLTSRLSNLGTGVAKSETAMPSASTSPRPNQAAFEPASLLVDRVDATGEFAPAAPTAAAPETAATSTAHRAVETVLNAAHRYSTGERHAVNLQFSVGGADLSVRVELRADEVRATFKTDSPELRAALSQEWQSAAAQGGERGLRLATPVFTGNDSSGFSAFSGDHTSQQQHRQPAARQPETPFTVATSRVHTARDAAPVSLSAAAPRIPNSTALHLHTLA
jgi:hypothetical protein